MHGTITRDSDDFGLVHDVFIDDGDVTFTTRDAVPTGRYLLHLLGGDVLAIRVLSSACLARDGVAFGRWSYVAELAARTRKYRRAPGPLRVPT
jgi:hypothetical protein